MAAPPAVGRALADLGLRRMRMVSVAGKAKFGLADCGEWSVLPSPLAV